VAQSLPSLIPSPSATPVIQTQAKNSKANPINSVKSACGIWENLSGGVEKNSEENSEN
jgi:hypothetical protein